MLRNKYWFKIIYYFTDTDTFDTYYLNIFNLNPKDNPHEYELMNFDGSSITLNGNTFFDSSRTKTVLEVHDWGGWCHDSVTSRSFNRYIICRNLILLLMIIY